MTVFDVDPSGNTVITVRPGTLFLGLQLDGLARALGADAQDVVVGGENEERHQERDADRVGLLHRFIGSSPSAETFPPIERGMTSIEERQGKEVEEADRHRDEADQEDELL